MTKLELRSLLGLASLYVTRMLGLFMVLPVLSVFGDHYQGANTALLGLALGVYGLTQSLFQIPLGILSDKIGRKTVILGGMVVFLVGSVVAANADTIYGLILGRALQGTGAVASAVMALLSDLTLEQNRTKAMAAVGGSIGFAFVLAMILGPILASAAGISSIFWVTAALAIAGIVVLVFWVPSPVRVSQVAARESLAVPSLLKTTLRHPELLRLDMGVFTLHAVQMASWISVPWILTNNLDFELSRHWWLYLLTMGVGFVLMLPFMIVGERRRRLKEVFCGAVALLVVAEMILYKSGHQFWLFALGLLLFFAAFNLLEASLPSLVSKVAPAGSRGTAMGIYSSSQFLGAFVGGAVGGAVVQVYGFNQVFLLSVLLATVWLVVALSMPRPRHWSTVVVPLQAGEEDRLGDMGIARNVPGVEEILLIPEQQLMYLKVDKAIFDRSILDKVLGRAVLY